MQSIDARGIFPSALWIMASALVSRPHVSRALPCMTSSACRISATATLRSSEENSSAKIFIIDSPLEFTNLLDHHAPIARLEIPLLVTGEFGPAIYPLDHRHSQPLIKILFQSCALN